MQNIFNQFLLYFRIEEIVSPKCYAQWKHKGDYFFLSRFDPRLLETMVFMRQLIGTPITINDWFWGGDFDERGLRDNQTSIVKSKRGVYLSAHVLGAAFDFDVEGMTATEVRTWIQEHDGLLPHKVRLEHKFRGREITWVHLDVINNPHNPKVYLFNV